MKNTGEIGCGLVLVVGVCAGAALLLTQLPWLLVAAPLLVVALILVADIFRDDAFVTGEQKGGFVAFHARYLTRIRALFGLSPVWMVPEMRVSSEERRMVQRATKLAGDVARAIKQGSVPETQKALLVQQSRDVPGNIAEALWRLSRLRGVANAADLKTEGGRQTAQDIKAMESQLLAEMAHSLDVLAGLPVSMMKVELSRDERQAERLMTDLSESNQKLQDLSEAYQELRATGRG